MNKLLSLIIFLSCAICYAWDLSSVPECEIWLKNGEGLTETAGNISEWKSMTGSASAVQDRADRHPQMLYESWPGYITAGYGNKGSHLVIENGPDSGQSFTLFYVGRVGKRTSAATLFGNMEVGSYPAGWQLVVMKTGNLTMQCGTNTRENRSFGEVNEEWFSAALVVDGVNYHFRNSLSDTVYKGQFEAPIRLSENKFLINARYRGDTPVYSFDGETAEVIYFDRALSKKETDQIWNYLQDKFPDAFVANSLTIKSMEPSGKVAPEGDTITIEFNVPIGLEQKLPVVMKNGLSGNPLNGKWFLGNGNRLVFKSLEAWDSGDLVTISIPDGFRSSDGKLLYRDPKRVLSFIVEEGKDLGTEEYFIQSMATVRNGEHNLPMKIQVPKEGGPFPVVFWVHGGGWSGGTMEESSAGSHTQADYLASRLGVASIGIAYRCKGSKGNFTEAMEDIDLAYKWVLANAKKYNLDMSRTGFSGGSAGSPLSSLAAQRYAGTDSYVGYNGVYNFVRNEGSRFATSDVYGIGNPSFGANSAIHNLASSPPQTLLLHGSADTTISPQQSVLFAEAIEKKGGSARYVIYEGEPHAFFNRGKQMELPTLYEVKEHYKEVFKLNLEN